MRLRVIAVSSVAVGLLWSTLQGCGSSFTAADGGSTDGASDAVRGDTGAEGSMCVTAPGGDAADTFCEDFAVYYSRCRYCETCNQMDVSHCAMLGGALSDNLKEAFHECTSTAICSPDLTKIGQDPCIDSHFGHGMTTAQAAAKTAYCKKCGDADPHCVNFFGLPPGMDADAPGSPACGGSPVGALILVSSDALTESITESCMQCGCGYSLCASVLFCAAAGPSSCTTGFCK